MTLDWNSSLRERKRRRPCFPAFQMVKPDSHFGSVSFCKRSRRKSQITPLHSDKRDIFENIMKIIWEMYSLIYAECCLRWMVTIDKQCFINSNNFPTQVQMLIKKYQILRSTFSWLLKSTNSSLKKHKLFPGWVTISCWSLNLSNTSLEQNQVGIMIVGPWDVNTCIFNSASFKLLAHWV